MIRSMTGYGHGEGGTQRFLLRAEVRSVNNRSLRITFRLPELLQGMEQEFERIVRDAISRGSVSAVISLDDLSGDPGYMLDQNALRYYRQSLVELQSPGEPPVSLAALVVLPGVVRKKAAEELDQALVDCAVKTLRQALDAFVASRETEGANLWQDLMAHCKVIEGLVNQVEQRSPGMLEAYRQRLSERLAKLLEGIGSTITEEDVRRELALFADRSDISEEIARMRSHLELVRTGPSVKDPFGRKLEFIVQEMFREANTMASKTNDPEMVHQVLDVKAEVEKLREQALNVE
jgi:uncharacterized protein (TIGR00255 family)